MAFKRTANILLLMVVLALMGCATQPPPTPEIVQTPTATATIAPTPTQPFVPESIAIDPREQVTLRFVNAATGYEALDIYAEELALASRLPFGISASGAQIVGGEYVLSVFPSGAPSDGEPLLRAPLVLEGGSRYTMLLTNSDNRVELAAIPDDLSALPAGQSRLLIIHAAPSLDTVDIGLAGEQALISDLTFTQSTPALTLPAGRVTLQARPVGSPTIDTTVNLRDGFGYTLVLQGERAQWLEFEDRVPGQAVAHFVNALNADLGAVDFYLDDVQVATALVFGAASDAVTIAAQTSTLRILPAGSSPDVTPIVDTSVSTNNGDFLAFVAVGDAASSRVILVTDSRQSLAPNASAITFLNAYPGARRVRNNGEGIIDRPVELDYASTPLSLETLSGGERFYWRETPDPESDSNEIFDPREFDGGTSYLYILTGREDAPALLFERSLPPPTVQEELVEEITVRWVNTIPDSAVTFTLDDIAEVERLGEAGQSVTQVATGSHLLTVVTGAGRSQARAVEFGSPGRWSIYAYGTEADPQFQVIADALPAALNEDIARVRLTYVAPEPSQRTLTLAFSPSVSGIANPRYEATPSSGEATFLPFGAETLVQRTGAGATSLAGQVPASTYDFYIIDDQQDGVIVTIPGAVMVPNTAYEIVAVQSLFNSDVEVYVLQVQPSS